MHSHVEYTTTSGSQDMKALCYCYWVRFYLLFHCSFVKFNNLGLEQGERWVLRLEQLRNADLHFVEIFEILIKQLYNTLEAKRNILRKEIRMDKETGEETGEKIKDKDSETAG